MRREHNRKVAESVSRPRILCVVTSSLGIGFLRGQLACLREAGYDVTVVSSPGDELTHAGHLEGVQIVPIRIAREIAPLRDLISLWQLWRLMRRLRPNITNVGTPKAGLLAGLAAFLSAIPCRFYTLRGLRLETAAGMQRLPLLLAERVACSCAHRVICVSESLRTKAVALGLVSWQRTVVLGSGSSNGVDISRFELGQTEPRKVFELRSKLGIPPTAPVVGFVGRFTRDKGIAELLQAFSILRVRLPELRLLLVGMVEEGDPPPTGVLLKMKTDPNIVCPGFVADPKLYYHIMDILALPTSREGFPNVVLEANASGKPAVVTRATGAVDSVIDGATGCIVPVGDATALADALARLLESPVLAREMGENARKRVAIEFQPGRIWSGLLEEYQSLLQEKGFRPPIASVRAAAPDHVAQTEATSS
jgi:glycosyltransferase involved in cell wall biosynthesis